MNIRRSATLGVACGAVAVWLAAAATSGVHPPAQLIAPRPSSIDLKGEALASEIQRLHERLRPSDSPTQNRDLFRYGPRRAIGVMTPSAASAPAPPALVEAPAAPAPALKLVGIAEDQGADGPVRTAIVSGTAELMFVRTGDMVARRFRVAEIGADTIELTDTADGSSLRLVLK